jgi:hypothetical protein
MTFIKKSDVKNHLSARQHSHIHLAPVSQPDATGFSGTNQVPVENSGPGFTQDFTGDHTTSSTNFAPSDNSTVRPRPQAPADFRPAKL